MKRAWPLLLAALFLTGWVGPARGAEQMQAERIKLQFNEREIIVKLADTPAARDFLSLLPLDLDFEDYAATEKISQLPRQLDTRQAPPAITPRRGDFTYYAPWGNLAVFYRDFRNSPGLVKLGAIESGLDYLEEITGGQPVRLERLARE